MRATMRRVGATLSTWSQRPWAVPLGMYLANLFLVYAVFLPNLRDINLWDEAAYVSSGKALFEGQVPSYADNPLVGLLYLLTYVPFRSSPFWLVQSTSLGRVILFSLLWLGTYLVAKRLSRFATPYIMLGMLFVTPLAVDSLRFPSDPLFASMAAVSFSFVLGYFQEGRTRDALWASFFLALAALARNDGLIVFLIFVPMMAVVASPLRRWKTSVAASIGPFAAVVGAYVIAAGLATGSYGLGTMQRTYVAFEQGQQIVSSGSRGWNAVVESQLEARRLFGTPEENHYSVFRAIQRNPSAYLERLVALVPILPTLLLHAYGTRFAIVLLLLAARGIWRLARDREVRLLGIFLLWPAHLATGFVTTLVREGYLLLPFFIVFALGAIGLQATIDNLRNPRGVMGWSIVLGALAVYGLLATEFAYYGAAVFLIALWLALLTVVQLSETSARSAIALLIFLCAGLVLHGGFPRPSARVLGEAPDEQAVLYMHDNFPPGTTVAAGAPGTVVMAGMNSATLSSTDVPTGRTPEEFIQWMRDQGIGVVYVDPLLTEDSPAIWELLHAEIGKGLERVFATEDGEYQILLVRPKD